MHLVAFLDHLASFIVNYRRTVACKQLGCERISHHKCEQSTKTNNKKARGVDSRPRRFLPPTKIAPLFTKARPFVDATGAC